MVALINAMIPLPGETPGQRWDATGQPDAMRAADERAGREGGFTEEGHFLHDVPHEVLAAAGASGQRSPADTPFGQPCEFEGCGHLIALANPRGVAHWLVASGPY